MINIKLLQLVYLMIILFITNSISQAQDIQSNVSTPKGNPVIAYITEEASDENREYFDDHFATAYPHAVQLSTYGTNYSSTRRFNCHGYAWYMTGVGGNHSLVNPRWIGYYAVNTDEAIYMSDGSYVQVENEMHPCKISWSSGDHSAISTTSTKYISKWNEWPLMEHDWDDTPFGTNNLKYYVSTNINGSTSVLCNNLTRSFFTTNIPDASYDWSVGDGLTLNNDGEYNTTVTANGSFSGNSWIKVEITSPLVGNSNNVKTSNKKTFWVGLKTSIVGNNYVSYLCSGNWYANSSCANNYDWYLKKEGWGGYVSIQNSSSNQLTLNSVISKSKKPVPLPSEETIFHLFVRASNGSGNYCQSTLKRIVAKGNVDLVVGNGGGLPPFELKISPNPANNIITVNIDNQAEKTNPNIEYTVRLLDKYQKTIYQRNIKNSQTTPKNIKVL